MTCPYCKSTNHKVKDTRSYETAIIRQRFCEDCQQYFKTVEEVQHGAYIIRNPLISTIIPK